MISNKNKHKLLRSTSSFSSSVTFCLFAFGCCCCCCCCDCVTVDVAAGVDGKEEEEEGAAFPNPGGFEGRRWWELGGDLKWKKLRHRNNEEKMECSHLCLECVAVAGRLFDLGV